jgi:hypothetical protein
MEKVAETYKAKFVVSSSEQGEEDPFLQNVIFHFGLLGLTKKF